LSHNEVDEPYGVGTAAGTTTSSIAILGRNADIEVGAVPVF
jgi:hypothetical protein